MRRPHLAALPLLTLALHAQAPRRPKPTPAAPNGLPVTRVALYKNGVGFFEHSGRVLGNQAVTIDFTTAQLNDVLQTLTAVDLGGGRIAGADYNSTTPLDQQLKSLPLALGQYPSDADFFNSIRGARVEVHGPGLNLAGRLLSIDLRTGTPGKDGQPAPQRRFLTVVSDSGDVRTFELTSVVSVRLFDPALHTDVTRYLELLAGNRNQGLRHLTLQDNGTGARDLRVSYLSEVPVWKSTYRILFTDSKAASQTATLQGWSVVDNTTGSDWIDVHLSLIAGAPQSFIQPLSTPYYTRRPEIALPAEAQLTPQTHDSGDAPDAGTGLRGSVFDQTGAVIPNAQITATNSSTGASQSTTSAQDGTYTLSLSDAGQYRVTVSAPGFSTLNQQTSVREDQTTLFTARLNVGTASESVQVTASAAAPMLLEQQSIALLGARRELKGKTFIGDANDALGGVAAAPPPAPYEQLANQSFQSQSTTSAFDDYFEYALTDPITIRKNESALVPTVQTKLPIERVTLWSPREPVALRALWLTNSSTLTLDRGSFSVVDSGNFAGEGLLDPIHPNERRLVSYAADQAVRVTVSNNSFESHVTHLKISKGVLTETSAETSKQTYDVRNAAPEPRTVIVEHPIRPGYTLDATPKPDEVTPTLDRFRVVAAPGTTEHLTVSERHTNYQYIRLVDRTEDQLILLLRNAKATPDVLAQLQPVFDAHHKVQALDAEIAARNNEISTIANDQNRIRQNLQALKGTPEEKALATRYTGELNSQEDRLGTLRKEIADLQAQQNAANQDFQAKLEAVNLDETL